MNPPSPPSLEARSTDGRDADGSAPKTKFTAEMFQSLADDNVDPQEKRARIDAALAAMGLPTIAEVNRLEREEAARKPSPPATRGNED